MLFVTLGFSADLCDLHYSQIRMNPEIGAPVRQLLEWVALRPRTYEEAMEAWKSRCPRFTVWEDASIEGLVIVSEGCVILTEQGRAALESSTRQLLPS